jgi:hypothetical protein
MPLLEHAGKRNIDLKNYADLDIVHKCERSDAHVEVHELAGAMTLLKTQEASC